VSSSRSKSRSIADNETFIRLIQLAQEDLEIKKRLMSILAHDDFNRKSLLSTWIEELQMQKAPSDFIKALSYFLDESVANTAIQLLED